MTELRQILRETADEPLVGGLDHAALLRAGRGRLRRRRRVTVAGAAVAVAVTTLAILLPGAARGPAERVLPAAPVRLSLDDARPVAPQVVARTRTVQSGDDLDYDQLDGVTEDRRVVRARYTYEGDVSEYGLIDPATGRTDWLPRPPWDIGGPMPLELGAERLLFLDNRHTERHHLLVFDRNKGTWTRPRLDLPEGRDRFFGLYAQLGEDERVYFPDLDPDPGPDLDWNALVAGRQWWSAPVTGGAARREPELDGLSVTWSGTARATSDESGRIVMTENGSSRTIVDAVPQGCRGLPALTFAGDSLLARYDCRGQMMLVVLNDSGAPQLSVRGTGFAVVGAGDRYALLASGSRAYVLDLQRNLLLDLGRKMTHGWLELQPTPAVSGDIVLWNVPGPTDSDVVFDVVYRAGRIPGN